ncbi:MAG TPA: glycoside hydrolase family 28 protein [Chitinophagaceae bacterium]
MKKTLLGFTTALVLCSGLQAQLNVRIFGAKGDGITLDTRPIQQAIDKAHANKGGVVTLPAGTYKIGTLILKDNVELHLQNGATLLGSANYKDYIAVKQQYESRTRGLYAKYFMIFAEGARNISITGAGTIYGNGLKHFQEERPQNLRPYMIRLVNCENVIIRDVKLMEAANWTLHLLGCREVNVDGIVIETTAEGNRDGLDIDACQRVKVSNSRFLTTDDAIVLKATRDELCENIVITNCVVTGCGGSGIKTGTESNGGFRNITVSNCVINNIPVHAGIELMMVDGGMMQNIVLDNIVMNNVATPFFIRLGIRARPFKPGQYVSKIDEVRDISLSNIIASNATLPSSIIGLHSKKIGNITVSNYTVRYKETQAATPYNQVSFQEFEYPAAVLFEKLPAFGLYCRSVDGLYLQNVNMYSADNEKRPALCFDRVNSLSMFSVAANAKGKSNPLAHFREVNNAVAAYCKTFDNSDLLFEAEENTVKDLSLSNNTVRVSQTELKKVAQLTDALIFDDFETDLKYLVQEGKEINGMKAHDLSQPLTVSMDAKKKGSYQVCLLALNTSASPQKLVVKYGNTSQEFIVNWNEWGWAPVSLLKNLEKDQHIEFTISSPSGQVKVARVYLRYQDIGFTD